MRFQDLTGQKIGKLTVLQRDGKKSPTRWICRCDCGKICSVTAGNLKSGKTKSCGCLRIQAGRKTGSSNFLDLTGQTFNFLTVLEKSDKKQGTNYKWVCRCCCGNITEVAGADLTSGKIKSCGCMKQFLNHETRTSQIIGQRFGKLVVLKQEGKSPDGSYNFLCQCDCGNQKIINGVSLRRGLTQSCGCINYSIGEKNILQILSQNNIPFLKEYIVRELNNKRFDFAILNTNSQIIRLIEFDGKQHYEKYLNHWQETCPLEVRQARDQQKNQWAKNHNIPLVRIPYWERDNITLDLILGDKYLVK